MSSWDPIDWAVVITLSLVVTGAGLYYLFGPFVEQINRGEEDDHE